MPKALLYIFRGKMTESPSDNLSHWRPWECHLSPNSIKGTHGPWQLNGKSTGWRIFEPKRFIRTLTRRSQVGQIAAGLLHRSQPVADQESLVYQKAKIIGL